MKARFFEGCVTFYREPGDPRFHGARFAKGERSLLRFVARWLNARGFDLIKKRAQLDGHMIGDRYQPYLRCASPARACRTSWSGRASTPCTVPTRTGITGRSSSSWRSTVSSGGRRRKPWSKPCAGSVPGEMSFGGEPHLRDLVIGNERTLA